MKYQFDFIDKHSFENASVRVIIKLSKALNSVNYNQVNRLLKGKRIYYSIFITPCSWNVPQTPNLEPSKIREDVYCSMLRSSFVLHKSRLMDNSKLLFRTPTSTQHCIPVQLLRTLHFKKLGKCWSSDASTLQASKI